MRRLLCERGDGDGLESAKLRRGEAEAELNGSRADWWSGEGVATYICSSDLEVVAVLLVVLCLSTSGVSPVVLERAPGVQIAVTAAVAQATTSALPCSSPVSDLVIETGFQSVEAEVGPVCGGNQAGTSLHALRAVSDTIYRMSFGAVHTPKADETFP